MIGLMASEKPQTKRMCGLPPFQRPTRFDITRERQRFAINLQKRIIIRWCNIGFVQSVSIGIGDEIKPVVCDKLFVHVVLMRQREREIIVYTIDESIFLG